MKNIKNISYFFIKKLLPGVMLKQRKEGLRLQFYEEQLRP
ncbi:hypothetical protein Patl1_18100 [Pistacia atlantica]|uniref:Uncharacterized protein n=1 Tax=Pistacia atlantica TaxID=434234 RepID=A0ACC1C1Y8_9ROSI|nr:hypothetical protein Patl1_18100 [Pistacia atlantica]